MRTAIKNSGGVRGSLLIPDAPFELLVRKAIARLLTPSLQCKEFVHAELLRIAAQCAPADITRFPKLQVGPACPPLPAQPLLCAALHARVFMRSLLLCSDCDAAVNICTAALCRCSFLCLIQAIQAWLLCLYRAPGQEGTGL